MGLNFALYTPGDVVATETGEGVKQKGSQVNGQASGLFPYSSHPTEPPALNESLWLILKFGVCSVWKKWFLLLKTKSRLKITKIEHNKKKRKFSLYVKCSFKVYWRCSRGKFQHGKTLLWACEWQRLLFMFSSYHGKCSTQAVDWIKVLLADYYS